MLAEAAGPDQRAAKKKTDDARACALSGHCPFNWHFLTNQTNNRARKWWRHKNEISEIMAFVRIFWKNNVQEAYLPKMSISGQIVSEIVAQSCLKNSIQTLLNFFGSTPLKISGVCMEFSEYSLLTSQRQFAPKCSFLVSRPLGHCYFRISWQIP